jgi:cob(I)alamin adenosyltransferase
MKIYTKTGDDGNTGIFGGGRISKADPRIACTGAIDELNAILGWAAAANENMAGQIYAVQSDLFALGAEIATPAGKPPAALKEGDVLRLEREIDAAEAQLAPLRNFILPGGNEAGARLHVARTLCRRAERVLVEFSGKGTLPPLALVYLNRLSDWLFVMARQANHIGGVTDVIWKRD